MPLLDDLRAILAEGPDQEARHEEEHAALEASAQEMERLSPDDQRLKMILLQGRKIQQLTTRNDQLELLLLRVGIESLERIERLEGEG